MGIPQYYHDHLYILVQRIKYAMKILKANMIANGMSVTYQFLINLINRIFPTCLRRIPVVYTAVVV